MKLVLDKKMPSVLSKMSNEYTDDPLLYVHEMYGVDIVNNFKLSSYAVNYRLLLKKTMEHVIPNVEDELVKCDYNPDELVDWLDTSKEILTRQYEQSMEKIEKRRRKIEGHVITQKQIEKFDIETVVNLNDDVLRNIFTYLPHEVQASVHMLKWDEYSHKLNKNTCADSLREVCTYIASKYYDKERRRMLRSRTIPGSTVQDVASKRALIKRLWIRDMITLDAHPWNRMTLKSTTKKARLFDIGELITFLINAYVKDKHGLGYCVNRMHTMGLKLINVVRYLSEYKIIRKP
jgi:hypothetical protein